MFLLVKIIGCVDEFFNVQCVFHKNMYNSKMIILCYNVYITCMGFSIFFFSIFLNFSALVLPALSFAPAGRFGQFQTRFKLFWNLFVSNDFRNHPEKKSTKMYIDDDRE